MKVNSEQQAILNHRKGPLLVVAGAGTGKTAIITKKIVNLIEAKHATADQILALTFTQKSSEELLGRLDAVMPLGYEEPWIGTFHGICDRVLKDEALHIGLDPNYKIMSSVDQWMLIKKHLFDFNLDYFLPLGNPSKFINSLIGFFGKIQDEYVSTKEIKTYLQAKKKLNQSPEGKEEYERDVEIFKAYETYQKIKTENSLMDFGDLLTNTLKLFTTRPSILKKYRKKWQHVFVDEFQDTNVAQFELIKKICPPTKKRNLIVVGDDDQSIYKFRGASVVNILQFKDEYPEAREIVLTKNYRSSQTILDHAYKLIRHNDPDRLEVKLGLSKKLESMISMQKGEVNIVACKNSNEEVAWIMSKIVELVSKNKFTFKDIAILGRANSHLDACIEGLKKAGIPFQQVGGRGLFNQPEIEVLLNFIEVIANPADDLKLFELLTFPLFAKEQALILKAVQAAKYQAMPLWHIIQNDNYFNDMVSMIKKFQSDSSDKTVSQILYDFIVSSKLIASLAESETVESTLKIKNVNLLFERIKRYESEVEKSSIISFIETLNLWRQAGENPSQATIEDIDTVSVMTAHASKGLEFEVVFIVNLVAGRFPSGDRRDPIEFPKELVKESSEQSQSNIQEERRLMYVALTRAKSHLYGTYTTDYGGIRKRTVSGFVNETGIEKIEALTKNPENGLEMIAPPKITELGKSGQVEIKEVSYTQIDTFKGCPLKYKYRYILKIPTLPYHTLTFGRSVHETLYAFHRQLQQGKLISKNQFIKMFKERFDESGYDSQTHKEKRFKKALKDLRHYYDHHQSLFGNPIHLERSFKLQVGDVVVNGKIDRIDESEDGIEIIDYKTGSPKNQEKVDKDDQLSLYALASTESFELSPQKLSLYFIESGQKVETTRNSKKLEKVRSKLEKDIEAMKTSEFPAKPDKVRCNFCEYNRICPFASNK